MNNGNVMTHFQSAYRANLLDIFQFPIFALKKHLQLHMTDNMQN